MQTFTCAHLHYGTPTPPSLPPSLPPSQTPFNSADRGDLYKMVLRGDYRVPNFVSPRARSLIYKVGSRVCYYYRISSARVGTKGPAVQNCQQLSTRNAMYWTSFLTWCVGCDVYLGFSIVKDYTATGKCCKVTRNNIRRKFCDVWAEYL